MAYFSNGSEGDDYEAKYCARCVNLREREGRTFPACPVLDLHADYNYEAVGKNADPVKAHVLETLWPRDGVHNGECRLFVEKREADGQ